MDSRTMMADYSDAVGLLAGALTTCSFLPQVIKTWRSRSAGDLSLVMFGLFSIGVLLWLVYGVLIDSLPVIVSNTVTLMLAGAILIMKILFK